MIITEKSQKLAGITKINIAELLNANELGIKFKYE